MVHFCINSPSTGSKHGRNFSFYTGNLPWYALVPVKFQISKINISLKICFLRCLVITTFGTPIWFKSWISWISTRKNTIKTYISMGHHADWSWKHTEKLFYQLVPRELSYCLCKYRCPILVKMFVKLKELNARIFDA